MSRNQKGYTGLREIGGGVPILGTGLGNPTQAQMHQAITQQIALLSREIYVRVAADWIREHGDDQAAFQFMAKQAHEAAKGYFLGLGIIEEQKPTEPADPASNETTP